MEIHSEQLGPIEVSETDLISFPEGLPGFGKTLCFCLVAVKPGSRFQLLQSTDDPGLAFVVTDPIQLDTDYPITELQQLAQASIGIEEDEPVGVAVMVTVPPPPARPTANLFAPLVIGTRSRVGAQLVLHDSSYPVRHQL